MPTTQSHPSSGTDYIPICGLTNVGGIPSTVLQQTIPHRMDVGVYPTPTSTQVAEAQAFFDQGTAYLHGYSLVEAASSGILKNQIQLMQPFTKIMLLGLLTAITLFTPLYGQKSAEEGQVKKVIVDAFQALADLDMPKFRSYCQPEFTLLENGEIWTVDTLEARVKPRIGSGMKRINTLDFNRVSVKGNIAWATYANQADIDINGQKRTINWLESAVLEKKNGAWKLAMLHSTVLPKKK